jgi:hypothetical protein
MAREFLVFDVQILFLELLDQRRFLADSWIKGRFLDKGVKGAVETGSGNMSSQCARLEFLERPWRG